LEFVLITNFFAQIEKFLVADKDMAIKAVQIDLAKLDAISQAAENIFFFKNRKRQKSFVLLSLLSAVAFIAFSLMRIEDFKSSAPAPLNGSYQPGIVVVVAVMVLLILAFKGIRKDDKLVKSMDRLR